MWRESRFRLAYDGEVAVGCLLVAPFERGGDPIVNIVRLMIEHRHQGQGLGRGILQATIDWISNFDPKPMRIRISTLANNAVALSLDKSHGFNETGTEDGEIVLYRTIE